MDADQHACGVVVDLPVVAHDHVVVGAGGDGVLAETAEQNVLPVAGADVVTVAKVELGGGDRGDDRRQRREVEATVVAHDHVGASQRRDVVDADTADHGIVAATGADQVVAQLEYTVELISHIVAAHLRQDAGRPLRAEYRSYAGENNRENAGRRRADAGARVSEANQSRLNRARTVGVGQRRAARPVAQQVTAGNAGHRHCRRADRADRGGGGTGDAQNRWSRQACKADLPASGGGPGGNGDMPGPDAGEALERGLDRGSVGIAGDRCDVGAVGEHEVAGRIVDGQHARRDRRLRRLDRTA